MVELDSFDVVIGAATPRRPRPAPVGKQGVAGMAVVIAEGGGGRLVGGHEAVVVDMVQ